MPFTYRQRFRVFPGVWLNLSRSEPSLTVRIWRWSWNSRTRKWSLDLPGPINWRSS